jgi:hypothetical protein
LLNPNFLLAHRNRNSEGTEDAQKTPRGHPDIKTYVQNLRVFIFWTDGRTDGWRHTLASRGLEEPFFQLCCCVVSVFGSGGKKVLIYIRMYYLEYNTVVVVC